MNPYETFIKKLDGLAIFQILAEGNVYEFVKQNYPSGKPDVSGLVSYVEYDYNSYRDFYMNSIFILAYSYFESFLYDIIFLCLKRHPELYSILNKIKKFDKDKIIIDDDIIKMRLDIIKFSDMRSLIENDLKLDFDDPNNITDIGNLTRNSLLHRNFKVSKKLQEKFSSHIEEADINKTIFIDNNALNMAANFVRNFAKILYEDAVEKFNI